MFPERTNFRSNPTTQIDRPKDVTYPTSLRLSQGDYLLKYAHGRPKRRL